MQSFCSAKQVCPIYRKTAENRCGSNITSVFGFLFLENKKENCYVSDD